MAEYWLYWYNVNKGQDEENPHYRFLSNKKMNKKELRYFFDHINQYNLQIDRNDGSVWEHKQIKFNKDRVVYRQLKFWY